MTNNTKTPNPTVTEAGAVELTETELDQASGGWSWSLNNMGTSSVVGQRKAGGGQPGIVSDPETGGERS